MRSKPKTACKTVKTDKCSHSSSQNPKRSDTGFAAFARSVEAHDGRLSRRETGIQIGKSKHHIGDQMLKNGKSASHNEQPIQKIKIFWYQNRSKKKTENPNESVMNRSVKSTCVDCIRIPTNDNTATNIISETSTKTFFSPSETCCKTTLVTRYFVQKVSCHAIELFIDYEHRCLTPCKLHSCSLTEFFFIIDLYFMAKWRRSSFKYRRGF